MTQQTVTSGSLTHGDELAGLWTEMSQGLAEALAPAESSETRSIRGY